MLPVWSYSWNHFTVTLAGQICSLQLPDSFLRMLQSHDIALSLSGGSVRRRRCRRWWIMWSISIGVQAKPGCTSSIGSRISPLCIVHKPTVIEKCLGLWEQGLGFGLGGGWKRWRLWSSLPRQSRAAIRGIEYWVASTDHHVHALTHWHNLQHFHHFFMRGAQHTGVVNVHQNIP